MLAPLRIASSTVQLWAPPSTAGLVTRPQKPKGCRRGIASAACTSSRQTRASPAPSNRTAQRGVAIRISASSSAVSLTQPVTKTPPPSATATLSTVCRGMVRTTGASAGSGAGGAATDSTMTAAAATATALAAMAGDSAGASAGRSGTGLLESDLTGSFFANLREVLCVLVSFMNIIFACVPTIHITTIHDWDGQRYDLIILYRRKATGKRSASWTISPTQPSGGRRGRRRPAACS